MNYNTPWQPLHLALELDSGVLALLALLIGLAIVVAVLLLGIAKIIDSVKAFKDK